MLWPWKESQRKKPQVLLVERKKKDIGYFSLKAIEQGDRKIAYIYVLNADKYVCT